MTDSDDMPYPRTYTQTVQETFAQDRLMGVVLIAFWPVYALLVVLRVIERGQL